MYCLCTRCIIVNSLQVRSEFGKFDLIIHAFLLFFIAQKTQKRSLSGALALGTILSKGRTARHIFGREPSNDYFIKILFSLSKWFQTRRFLWEFPIGSYVKLSSAVVAILVVVLKCRTQFWKRTTQESFQQSLVEIGSVVSEEIIFFNFIPPFFLICIIGRNRQKFKVHQKSCNNVKKLIIMLIQFNFGHILA